jgi:hypothetical protein
MKSYRSTIIGFATLIVLLSAGAAQSLSGTNTVDSGDIVDGQVAYSDIRSNAITGSKVLDNSIAGTDISESTLVLTCRNGLTRAGDVCYSPIRPSATWNAALADCADERLRLPSMGEGRVVEQIAPTLPGIWTDDYFIQGTSTEKAAIAAQIPVATAVTDLSPYRCIASIGARP